MFQVDFIFKVMKTKYSILSYQILLYINLLINISNKKFLNKLSKQC